jgi:hypothetical protein
MSSEDTNDLLKAILAGQQRLEAGQQDLKAELQELKAGQNSSDTKISSLEEEQKKTQAEVSQLKSEFLSFQQHADLQLSGNFNFLTEKIAQESFLLSSQFTDYGDELASCKIEIRDLKKNLEKQKRMLDGVIREQVQPSAGSTDERLLILESESRARKEAAAREPFDPEFDEFVRVLTVRATDALTNTPTASAGSVATNPLDGNHGFSKFGAHDPPPGPRGSQSFHRSDLGLPPFGGIARGLSSYAPDMRAQSLLGNSAVDRGSQQPRGMAGVKMEDINHLSVTECLFLGM